MRGDPLAVEIDGNVRMRGDTGPGVRVRVVADDGRLRIVSGNELMGDWMLANIGMNALQEGFNIKAEGEEFILRTEDDVALAEEIGVAAASPRLARLLAARHNPEEPAEADEPLPIPSHLASVGFALAGALIVLGGVFLEMGGNDRSSAFSLRNGGGLSLAFVIGGALMIAAALVMALGARLARVTAGIILLGMIVAFGVAVSGADAGTAQMTAFGFIAGGLVVGVAVLSSGSLRPSD